MTTTSTISPPGSASTARSAPRPSAPDVTAAGPTIESRVASYDWASIGTHLDAYGWAPLGGIVSAEECRALAGLYDEGGRFRSRIIMARHGFGRGEYQYFAYPLPGIIADLRTALYPRLAPIADRWNETMGIEVMRLLQLAAHRSPAVTSVTLTVHADVAFYLLNRKRREIAAQEEKAKMEARIAQLFGILEDATIVEIGGDGDEVRIGTIVTLRYERDDEDEVEKYLVGSIEEASEGVTVISPTSALGEALMGAKAGDSVTYDAPNGSLTVIVVSLG